MRNSLFNPNLNYLQYGIREIVLIADQIRKRDPKFTTIPENIGDPIIKGWTTPQYVKDLISDAAQNKDIVWGYVHSRGLKDAREWVARDANRCYPKANLDIDDIVFANGLGAAIGLTYVALPEGARVIQPSPAYPTHASLEAFSAGKESISYNCDPKNGWEVDLKHLESQIQAHPDITGILVINPNNPTGAVYSRETLEQIVDLALKYNLFIIADEIYYRLVYNGKIHHHMSAIVDGRVPLIVMRGISKDIPWPGSRCGWMEFHNTQLDPDFKAFTEGVKKRILLEVGATAMPQHLIPYLYEHPDYQPHLKASNKKLEENSNTIAAILNSIPEVTCNPSNGAFYITSVFESGVLHDQQSLPIENTDIRTYIEQEVSKPGIAPDKQFAYYLLANTGIVATPASDFFSPHFGFRVTTLERDPEKLKSTYDKLKAAIQTYLAS
jgi:aspartate/methionine/tyrosine aminotransferase